MYCVQESVTPGHRLLLLLFTNRRQVVAAVTEQHPSHVSLWSGNQPSFPAQKFPVRQVPPSERIAGPVYVFLYFPSKIVCCLFGFGLTIL